MATSVVGDRIKKAREKAGLTQQQLAEPLMVHKYTVSKWERGETSPQKPSDYVVIARTCNVSLPWLRDGKGSVTESYQAGANDDRRLRESRIMDPAAGSGAFLVASTGSGKTNWILLAELVASAMRLEPKIEADRLAKVMELGQAMAAKGAKPDEEMVATILRMVS